MNENTKGKKALADEDLDAVNGGVFEMTPLISKGSRKKKKGTNPLVYRGGDYQASGLVHYETENNGLTMSNLVAHNNEEEDNFLVSM